MLKLGTRHITYRDVKFDSNGWADASLFIPPDYELMHLKTSLKRTIPGWAVGHNWDSYRIKDGEQVLFWKRNFADQ